MSDLFFEMAAFHDELVKEAGPPVMEVARQVLRRAVPMASKLRPQSVLEGAHMGVRGARIVGGALAGGARSTAKSVGKSVSDFAKRQAHGATGWTPKSGLESIGFQGSKATGEALGAAKAAVPKKGKTGILQKVMYGRQAGTKGLAEKVKERSVARAGKLHEATKAHEAAGLTSLPSWAKGMATKPVQTMKAGLGKEWHSGTMGKAMIGLPAAAAAHQLAKPSEEGGPGRLERAGRSLGETAWSMGLPIAPAMLASSGISHAAAGAGRLVGKLTGREKISSGRFAGKEKDKPELGKKPAPPSIDAGGQTQPSERIMTAAAQGKPPEDVIS